MDSTELFVPGLDRLDTSTLIFARGFKQYCKMIQDLKAGKCSFCGDLDPDLNEVVFENKLWRGWYYKGNIERANLAYQALVAPFRHITRLRDLTPEDWACLGEIVVKFDEKDNLPGGAIMMRFGDPWLNAGTFRHLHKNIFVPNGKGPVRQPLRKTNEEFEEDVKKALVFEKMRLDVQANGVTPEEALAKLGPDEYELVKDRLK